MKIRTVEKAAALVRGATAAKTAIAATALAATAAAAAMVAKAAATDAGAKGGARAEAPRVAAPSARAEAAAKAERKMPAWMADHLQRYLATNGADGHIWRGVPTLLLTTTGRNSGEPLLLPLIYGKDDDRFLVVASKGGAPDHPSWYKNLAANPQVDVQVGADRFRGRARTANRDERPRLWRTMTKIWPDYDQYQSRTQREIPVVVIERV